jgi:hypothetical protein
MNKRLLMMLAGFLAAVSLQAQNVNRCGTDAYTAWMEQNDPSFAAQRQLIWQQVQQYMAQQPAQKGLVTIPVVFHVLYANSAQNVPTAKIQAQVNQLNLDYWASNPDTSTVPSAFKSHLGLPQIQFCLAKRTPTGQVTDGIIRKSTTVAWWTTDNAIKYAPNGSDAWPRTSYLNIWVGNLSGGLLGYAQFPGGSAATDGVVLHYGTVGSAASPSTFPWGGSNYNWGRSGTHEIGHWLGLRHTFEGGCPNTNCNTQGDHICDTPPVSGPSYGCPSFPKISCSNGPSGGMFMNYMDYVDDNCMKMFSDSQGLAMNGVLNTSRVALKSSLGCVPLGIEEKTVSWTVNAWPNPAGELVEVSFAGANETLELSLVDANGRVVHALTVARSAQQRARIDVSSLAAGLYTLRVRGTEGTVYRKISVLR